MLTGYDNIKLCYSWADAVDTQEGMQAYQRYHDLMCAIAKHYRVGFCQTVAAFAALSPNNDYVGNLRSLISVIQGYLVDQPWRVKVSTYNACRDRAHKFLSGELDFLMTTKGLKTRAFYHNIVNPQCKKHVTIDGHMYGVWSGKRLQMTQVAQLKIPYSQIETDFKKVAATLGVIPNQLQAILWFTWKRHHNVVYNPQLTFDQSADDLWGLNVDPSTIKPFVILPGF